ncbi:DUF6221 family protein [Streptomyces diastatochromogenes]|uniref:DUF6221 family protein n=1 Tax=Streptomyces diastatochromogenes TaxID=42236 RepID=UPI00365CEDEB
MLEDLDDWLLEQVEEDARIVGEAHASPEMMTGLPRVHTVAPVAAHIAHFADPARVLDEIDVKRLIIRWHRHRPASTDSQPNPEGWECATCNEQFPCKTLRLLAAPYGGRPGYREEWRP